MKVTKHYLYRTWESMRQRCNNPNHIRYKRYGGRGIKIAKRWDCFKTFVKDVGKRPSKKHSLDRIDNNKGYYPFNCRWATIKQQNNNKRKKYAKTR